MGAGRSVVRGAVRAPAEVAALRASLVAIALVSTTATAYADVVVSDEIDTDAPVIVPSIGFASSPRLASDGTDYFVVWADVLWQPRAIKGARISAAGEVLDPTGIQIGTDLNGSGGPSCLDVAFDGTDWVVTWIDATAMPMIHAARVTTAGVLLDDPSITLGPATWFTNPRIASNGNGSLVVWEGQGGVRAARISPDGAVLDPDGLLVTTNGASPAVASDGSDYLVAFSGGSVRIDAAGDILDATPIATPTFTSAGGVAVAWGTSDYLVVVAGATGGQGVRVDSNGQVLDTPPISLMSYVTAPALAFRNGHFLLSYLDGASGSFEVPRSLVIDESGGTTAGPSSFVGAPPLSASTVADMDMPAIAASTSGYLGAWRTAGAAHDGVSTVIVEVRVSDVGDAIDDAATLVSRQMNAQIAPIVVGDDDGYALVWGDTRDYPVPHALGERVLGGMAQGDPFMISDRIAVGGAWAGAEYVFVDAGNLSAHLTRIATDGKKLGDAVLSPPDWNALPISRDGETLVVGWDGSSAGYGLLSAAIAPDGTPLPLSIGPTFASVYLELAAAWGIGEATVLWTNAEGVYLASLDSSGAFGPTIPVEAGCSHCISPAIAFDGSRFVLAWISSSAASTDVHVATWSPTLGLGAIATVSVEPTDTVAWRSLGLAFDGIHYVLARSTASDVRGEIIDRDGGVVGADFPISMGSSMSVSVSSGGVSGQAMVAYTRTDAPVTPRVHARLVSEEIPPISMTAVGIAGGVGSSSPGCACTVGSRHAPRGAWVLGLLAVVGYLLPSLRRRSIESG